MLWTLKNKKLILGLGSVTVAFKKTWHLSCSEDETGILDIYSFTVHKMPQLANIVTEAYLSKGPSDKLLKDSLPSVSVPQKSCLVLPSKYALNSVLMSTLKQTALDISVLLVPALSKWISVLFCSLSKSSWEKSSPRNPDFLRIWDAWSPWLSNKIIQSKTNRAMMVIPNNRRDISNFFSEL